jgi:hypothetical protein
LKQLQEAVGNILEQISIGNNILNRTQNVQYLRETMSKWDYIKLNSFCTTKESHQTQETAPRMVENLCQLLVH